MRKAVDEICDQAGLLGYVVCATGVLVETLLERGAEGDLAEAEDAIDRLADLAADESLAMRDIWLLRLRALLARARGDDAAYRDLVTAIARWRHRLASKDTWRGPRRCRDSGEIHDIRESGNFVSEMARRYDGHR